MLGRQQEMVAILQKMSAKEFIPLAKAAEQRALAEPKEARRKRDLYLSKIDYDSLDENHLEMLTNQLVTTTFLAILNDENYVPHPKMAKALNIFFGRLILRKTAYESRDLKRKLFPQLLTRIDITKAAIDLFDKFYVILFNETEPTKQKEAILKLEQQLLALKNMHEKAKKDGLLEEPQVSKMAIEDMMIRGVDALHSYLSDDKDEMSRLTTELQNFKNGGNKVHDQLQSLINKMGNYPITLCTWFVKVFLAARKGVNFEATCLAIKKEIETAQGKAVFSQLREALPLASEVVKENSRSADAPAESKTSATSHAVAMSALAEHKEQMQKSRHDVKEPEERKESYPSPEGKAKAAAAGKDGKDQKGASHYAAGSATVMRAPTKAPSSVLALSGAQAMAVPVRN